MQAKSGLTRAEIDEVIAFVEQHGLSDSTVQQLRSRYMACHFTYCADDDVHFSKAYVERSSFNVYLVDSREHCSTITTDFETASGVVLAEIRE